METSVVVDEFKKAKDFLEKGNFVEAYKILDRIWEVIPEAGFDYGCLLVCGFGCERNMKKGMGCWERYCEFQRTQDESDPTYSSLACGIDEIEFDLRCLLFCLCFYLIHLFSGFSFKRESFMGLERAIQFYPNVTSLNLEGIFILLF